MAWQDVVTPVVIASITSVGLTWVKEFFREKREKKSTAIQKAIILALQLEKFSIECSFYIQDLDIYNRHCYDELIDISKRSHDSLPNLGVSLGNDTYKEIKTEYVSQIANLLIELQISQASIKDAFDVDIDIGIKELLIQAGVLGYKAWNLSKKLRKEYNLLPLELENLGYNPIEEYLIPQYQEQIKKEKQQ